jgi:hypothetical protein
MRPNVFVGIVACLALLSVPGLAQLSVDVEPNPLYPGDPVTLTLTESLGGTVTFFHGCYVDEVRAVNRHGPVVWTATACPDIVITLEPYTSLTHTWAPRDSFDVELGPGTYALRMSFMAKDPTVLEERWVAVTWLPDVDAPTLLRATDLPRVGAPVLFELTAPQYAQCLYFVGASFTTEVGFEVVPNYLRAALDPDALFSLSFPEPVRGLFMNFQGTLDGFGRAPQIGILVPDLLPLTYMDISVQALVLALEPGRILPPNLTNLVTFTLKPRLDG